MLEICPVCKGTGRVPAGFYSVYYPIINVPDEACRSCEGKGYINVLNEKYNNLNQQSCFTNSSNIPQTINKNSGFRTCGGCSLNDGLVYTSNPPKVKCTILNTYRYTTDKCFLYNVNSSVENVYDKLIELLKELKEEKSTNELAEVKEDSIKLDKTTSDTANSTVKEIGKTNKSISISWGYARTESELPSISQLYSDYPDEGRLLLFLVGQDDNVPKKVYVFSRKSECYMHLCNEDEINWNEII